MIQLQRTAWVHVKPVWQSGTTKPLSPGVYRRELNGVTVYSKWSGRQWFQSCNDPELAAQQTQFSNYQALPWAPMHQESKP